MTDSQRAGAGGANAVATEEHDALLVLEADTAGGGILHLLDLELEALDLVLKGSSNISTNQ